MTLPLNSRLSALYDTNGTQKDFSFGFRVFFDPDNGGYGLEVRRQTADGYEVIPKSDYLVLPVEDNSAGVVRFSVAPSAGQQIYIAGKTPTIQQLVLTNFGRYSAESIETQFDFITAIIQEWLSALGEETRQRIAADDILTQYVVNRIDDFVQQVNQNWDDKSQELEDYIASIMPSFTQTLREEIEAFAVAGMQDAIDQTLADSKAEIDDAVSRANAAATAAAITVKLYDTPEAGVDPVTGVAEGEYFNVRSSSDESYVDEYQNVGGVPTPSGKSYPSAVAVNELKEFASVSRKSEYAFTPSSALDHTTELQAAIDYCAANFLNCKPIGLFKTSGKVVIKGEFDGSRCRVQTQVYGPIAATPIAVEVSTGIGDNPTTIISLTESERIILPDVVNGTKPVTGWVGQGIGVRYVNVQNTQITERLVQDFAIGVQHTSYNQGCGYCNVDAGYLRNNKINRQFTVGNDTGFTNRWDLYGGRYFHSSSEGLETAGVMHFDVVPNATGNIINDINHWGGSFEGITQQYHLRLGGTHINFWGIRLETSENTVPSGIKVHLAAAGLAGQGSACGIHAGRGISARGGGLAGGINLTADPLSGKRMTITSTSGTSYIAVAGVGEIRQSTSSPDDFLYVGVEPLYNYGDDVSTGYSFALSPKALLGKRRADTGARVLVDFQNARTYYGNGSGVPTIYLGLQGSGSLGLNAPFIPNTNATHTLGTTGFAWDRLFLAKGFGVFGVTPLSTQPTIAGKKTPTTIAEQNAVLDSIISALSAYGLVVDNRIT